MAQRQQPLSTNETVPIPLLRYCPRFLLRFVLRRVASRIGSTAPLRRVPGWWSGYTLAAPQDGGRELRRMVWQALAGETVRVDWYDGLRLELRMGTDLSRLIYIGGEVDPNEFSFLANFLKPGMFVLDVGANEGLYSLFCRQRVGREGRVIAIEPSLREGEHLQRNLRLNHFNDVEVLPVALGDRVGTALLSVAEASHAGHNALGVFAAPWVSASQNIEVPLTTLDTLSAANSWPKVDLIKLDVEGSEFAVLMGAERLLARDRPVLLFEAESESLALRQATVSELLAWVSDRKYELMDFSGEDGSPVPLGRREPGSANLLAVPANAPR